MVQNGGIEATGEEATKQPVWGDRMGQIKSVSPRDVVSEWLLDVIRGGDLKPGDRLPSEQELIQMTGVSRSSVREAIRSLATMQLVEIRRGKGTYIREVVPGGMTDAQVLLMLDDRKALEDLVEVRVVLEPLMAHLAAERAQEADLAAIQRALRGMDEAGHHAAWRKHHLDFHQALADATHNIILTKMWALIQMFLKDSPMVLGQPSVPHVHDDLGDAIARHDVDRAETAMRAHIGEMTDILS